MLVLPRMVRILTEGLNPVSRGARTWLNRRFPNRDLYIGLDAALAVGQPAVIATALLLVPVVLVLAIILSFVGMNRMLPFTDLATLPFFSIWAIAWSRGNIVRGIITGAIFMCAFLIIGTFLAPATTDIAGNAGFAIPAGALEVSSLDGGGHVVPWLLALPFLGSTIANLGAPLLVACALVVVGVLACYAAFFALWRDEAQRDRQDRLGGCRGGGGACRGGTGRGGTCQRRGGQREQGVLQERHRRNQQEKDQ
jgi:galactitol PTS system EIIC component